MTSTTPLTTTNAYFDALGRGDVPAALAQFADDITWHQPGSNRFSGEHHGVAAVGALLAGMMHVSEGTFQLAVTGHAMANGALVAVPVRFSAHREDTSMDMSGIDLLTVREGKIVEVRLFSGDGASEDLFWGRPSPTSDHG